MNKICIVSCYIGKFPRYFKYYVHSANFNKDVQFIIFTDNVSNEENLGNIKYLPINLESFNNVASIKLSFEVNVINPYKLCDFKPLYGKIFEDQLRGYDFWAFSDIDIIWGNIRQFLPDSFLAKVDVCHTRANWTTGHFTLIRNYELTNSLYKDCPTYREVLTSEHYFQFDESCRRWNGEYFRIEDLVSKNLTVSFYDIVTNRSKNGSIALECLDQIREDPSSLSEIKYKFISGKLIDLNTNKEFFYYHLVSTKKLWRFYIPKEASPESAFYIDRFGIRDYNSNPFKAMNWWSKKLSYSGENLFRALKRRTQWLF